MVSRKSAPSALSLDRANRQRIAQEEGVRAMVDVEQRSAALRKNMARLRALREAKEAEDAVAEAAAPPEPPKKVRKKKQKDEAG